MRYHLKITRHGITTRTTVNLNETLASLLAASLGRDGTPADHSTVRGWVDNQLSTWAAFDPLLPLTQQVTHLALLQIARPEYVAMVGML